jgi:hypothetical protein
MKGCPTVDIVIDNWNYARYLPAALDSALAQTLPPTHVVVVDDGSTDESRAIIESYGERVVSVFQRNQGQAAALNAGYSRTNADVVVFLDSDDVLLPETVRHVADAFRVHPDAAKVQYRMEVVNGDGRATGATKPARHLPLPSGDVRTDELAHPFDLTWMPTSGNAFPRHVLERLMPIPEDEFRDCADWYLQHLPPLLGPVVSMRWIGAQYRVHDRNSYELVEPHLDLRHVRQTVRYARVTGDQLARLATELELDASNMLSVADVANRLVSLRLDPGNHPIASDTRADLVALGLRAAKARRDVRAPIRFAFRAWFLLAGALPRPLARPLMQTLVVPERHISLGPILERFNRPRGSL